MSLRNKKTGQRFFPKAVVSVPVGIESPFYVLLLSGYFFRAVFLIIIIMLWGLLATGDVPAATPAPGLLKIDASQKSVDIGTGFQHLLDSEKTFTLADVVKPDAPWRKEYRSKLHLGASDDIIWIRFSVQNRSTSQQTMVLNVDWPFWDLIELYVQDGDVAHRNIASIRSVTAKKNRLPFAFEFPCPANQQLNLYLRVHSSGVLLLPLKIWKLHAYEQMCLYRNLFLGMFFGVLIAMCIPTIWCMWSLLSCIACP
jgi:diguanylate cyclase